MCFLQVPAPKAVDTSNAFAALTREEPDVLDPPEPVVPAPPRVGLVTEFGASRKCCEPPRSAVVIEFSAPRKCCDPKYLKMRRPNSD